MFRDLKLKYGDWVLDVLEYDTVENLVDNFEEAVVKPALMKSDELAFKKAQILAKRRIRDFGPADTP